MSKLAKGLELHIIDTYDCDWALAHDLIEDMIDDVECGADPKDALRKKGLKESYHCELLEIMEDAKCR